MRWCITWSCGILGLGLCLAGLLLLQLKEPGDNFEVKATEAFEFTLFKSDKDECLHTYIPVFYCPAGILQTVTETLHADRVHVEVRMSFSKDVTTWQCQSDELFDYYRWLPERKYLSCDPPLYRNPQPFKAYTNHEKTVYSITSEFPIWADRCSGSLDRDNRYSRTVILAYLCGLIGVIFFLLDLCCLLSMCCRRRGKRYDRERLSDSQ